MNLIEQLKGDPKLNTTLTVKINDEVKDELIEFGKKNGISLGKMVRFGLALVMSELEKELK